MRPNYQDNFQGFMAAESYTQEIALSLGFLCFLALINSIRK